MAETIRRRGKRNDPFFRRDRTRQRVARLRGGGGDDHRPGTVEDGLRGLPPGKERGGVPCGDRGEPGAKRRPRGGQPKRLSRLSQKVGERPGRPDAKDPVPPRRDPRDRERRRLRRRAFGGADRGPGEDRFAGRPRGRAVRDAPTPRGDRGDPYRQRIGGTVGRGSRTARARLRRLGGRREKTAANHRIQTVGRRGKPSRPMGVEIQTDGR